MKTLLIECIEETKKGLTSKKAAFIIMNGGWEKHFENELAFNLYTKGKSVKTQSKWRDVVVLIDDSKCIVEIGHYTLNQKLNEMRFKPLMDIQREEARGNNYPIFHIMLLESIEPQSSKYGAPGKFKVSEYLNLYEKMGLRICEKFSYTFRINKKNKFCQGYIILSARSTK